jgi:peptidoglycan/xylan/chitin deacetylase (PgdA/CDA1 family)
MPAQHIPILMYHQIDTRPVRGTPLRGLVVSPSSFARQMAMLKILGYQGLSMSALMPYLQGHQQGKVVGITFDDGYVNNIEHALPVLKKNGFSATCYLVSGQLGGTNLWDADKGIATKPLMQATQARAWVDGGQEVGAHSRSHADLTILSADQAYDEIVGSKQDLENVLGAAVSQFCYPYGRYTAQHVAQVRAAGYAAATTTARGRACTGDSIWELPRVPVMGSVWLGQLWQKIATSYEDKRRGA